MDILKKYWREAAILILFIVCMLSVRSCRNQQEKVKIAKAMRDSTFFKSDSVRLKNGELAYRVNTLEVTNHQLKGEGVLTYLQIKKLTDQIGNLNRLITFYQGSLTMDDTFSAGGTDTVLIEVKKKDTINTKAKKFLWHGKWLTLLSVYNPATDSINHQYHYQADFNLVTYRRGANLFRRGDLVTDITFNDPSISVGEFQGVITKEPPPKRFSIGPAIGYDILNNRPSLTISVQWSIIRF